MVSARIVTVAVAPRLRRRAGEVHCRQSSPPFGSPRTGGAFFACSAGACDRLGVATRRRLLGLPERLSPRPRCVLRSRRGREGRPGRSTGARASAAGRVPGGRLAGVRVYRGRPSQRRDARSYAAYQRQTDTQVSRGHGLVTVISRDLRYPPDWPRRAASGEGHRRGARRRLRHDGRPTVPATWAFCSPATRTWCRRWKPCSRCGPGPAGVRSGGVGWRPGYAPIALGARRAYPSSPAHGSRLPHRSRISRTTRAHREYRRLTRHPRPRGVPMPEPFDVIRGICGTPPWPPPRRPSAAPPATPRSMPRSASPVSTPGCQGCSVPESARPAAQSSATHVDRHSGATGSQAAWCSHACSLSGQELANLLI